jgi:hypothetical protein
MFCKYCAAELEDSAKFCSVCGKLQQAQAAASQSGDGASGKAVCGNCGKDLERSWMLCLYCGTKVNYEPADEAKPDIAEKPLAARKQEPEKAGLYDGNEYRGPLDILDSIDWITLNGKDGGNYLIVLGKDEAVPYAILQFEGKHVSVSLKSLGPECTVQREGTFDKPLFAVGSGVTFILEAGVALVGVSGNKAPVVVVKKDGTFIMNGGSISGNSIKGSGSGVDVQGGTFTMNGGSISGNSVWGDGGSGGGVYVRGGTFTMSDGTISGNSAHCYYGRGGGVCVFDGTFTMSGGTISGNSTQSGGANYGGGVYVKGGTFTMNDGSISRNSSYGDGGGVCVMDGTFTMSGGTISGNSSQSLRGGGGVYVEDGTFTMSDGTISGNSVAEDSDSVYGDGGGVYVRSGTFTMSGGTISGNSSHVNGGGVYVEGGIFIMNSGMISGNSAKGKSNNYHNGGGGVYVSSSGRFIKSKGSVIYGSNTPAEQANTAPSGAVVYCSSYKIRNTTARLGTVMDSEKDGTEGGWE